MSEQPMTDQSRGAARWIVLMLMSLVIFSNYYLYDCFSTLKATVQTEIGATSTQWGMIRNFYNVPNTFLFMALLGGIFLDRFGIRKTGFTFTLLCALGGIVTAYGASPAFRGGAFGHDLLASFLPAYSPELKMMMLGRLLFGLGAETQIVMLNKVMAKWFMGKELAFAFGLNLGIARVGSALGMSFSPRIAERFGFNSSLWVGAVVMVSGLVLFIIYMGIDRRDEKRRGSGAAGALLAPEEEFHLRDVWALFANRSYLFIVLLCATFYAVGFPFQDYLADLLKHKFGYSEVAAGDITSLIPWGAAIFTVIFGWLVDKKGLRTTLMIGGSILLFTVSLLFATTRTTPWLLVPLFGVSFSLVPAALWPAVALIVEERRLGTAYGLMTWMQNLWWWAMALVAGKVLDLSNPGVTPETLRAGTGVYDYTVTMLTFTAMAGIAVVVAFALRMADRGANSHGLELPSGEAAALNEAHWARERGD